jgi:hypothetical protein
LAIPKRFVSQRYVAHLLASSFFSLSFVHKLFQKGHLAKLSIQLVQLRFCQMKIDPIQDAD